MRFYVFLIFHDTENYMYNWHRLYVQGYAKELVSNIEYESGFLKIGL